MENFVVSARKYRPATFNTVVGQRHITDTLRNAIRKGQLSHAYLFTGPRGVGKTTCARIFAKAINCLNPTPEAEACGVCESCVAFDSGRSFNIHELDAASNNSVDDIRALNEKVRIAPQVGRYSLYIIDEVHMLSTGAFNAFLKTLEEPPHYAVFILATTEKHKILPTILSRCQSYDFKRIRVEDIVDYLKYIAAQEGVGYDEESLHMIAAKADGGMRDALSTFDRVVSFCGSELAYDQVAACIGSLDLNTYFAAMDMVDREDFPALLMLLDEILGKGFEAGQFVSGLLEHVRNLLVVKNPQTASLLEVSAAMVERYRTQAMKFDLEMLMNAMNLLNIADNGYKLATNRRLHVELALVKLCGLKKKDRAIADVYPMPQIMVQGGSTTEVVGASENRVERNPSSDRAQFQEQSLVPQSQPIAQSLQEKNQEATSAVQTATQLESGPKSQIAQAQTIQNPQPTAVHTTIAQPTLSGRGVSRFSLSNVGTAAADKSSGDASKPIEQAAPSVMQRQENLSDEQVEKVLLQGFSKVIALWNARHRPRIATALTENVIAGRAITIVVPDESPAQEILQNKPQIERDVLEQLGVQATLQVDVRDVPKKYAPVSVEQKLQHLIDINPNITKLRDELDLTL